MKTKIKLFYAVILVIMAASCNRAEKAVVQRKELIDAVFANGNIVTKDKYLITSQVEGYLQICFAEEGDSVKKGELLFQLRDKTAKAQLESAEFNFQKAKENLSDYSPVLQKLYEQKTQLENQLINDSINFLRYNELIKSNAVSKADYDKIKLAYSNTKAELKVNLNSIEDTKQNLQKEYEAAKSAWVSQKENRNNFLLTSQTNGLLMQCFKEKGELIKKGEVVAEIGAGNFIARLQVAEDDINRVKVGQIVYIELNTNRNHAYKAEVTKIYPAFNNEEQSFIVEAGFKDSVPHLKSGTQLQSNIIVEEKKDALVIPVDFLLPDKKVYSNVYRKEKNVETGLQTSEWVEIISGLQEGEVIEKLRSWKR